LQDVHHPAKRPANRKPETGCSAQKLKLRTQKCVNTAWFLAPPRPNTILTFSNPQVNQNPHKKVLGPSSFVFSRTTNNQKPTTPMSILRIDIE
jgi:hypothetical protein